MTGPGETRPPLHLASEPLAQLSAYRTKPDPAPVKLDANESPWPLPEDARRRLAERLADPALGVQAAALALVASCPAGEAS